MKNVIKRDGVVVPFDKEKIKNAIMKAMVDTGVINEEIANFVALSCAYLQEETKNIYEIEQYIIEELTRLGRSDAAIAYHDYKMQRTEERCKNDAIYKEFKSVIECEDVKNSNANVDEYSFGGRKFEASSIIHKDLALKLLPKRVSDAHKNNIVYQHDLDSHTVGMHNCLAKETKFITSLGVKSFEELNENDEITVLTHTGEWKKAIVKSYGEQQLYNIVLKRGEKGKEVMVRATKDHRWLLKNNEWTTELKIGDNLISAPDKVNEFSFDDLTDNEKFLWCCGFAHGDGTIEKTKNKRTNSYTNSNRTRIRLCGKKTKFLSRFIECGFKLSEQFFENGDVVVKYYDNIKSIPDMEKLTLNEKIAYINGYYDADGQTVNSVSIDSKNDEDKILIENYFELAGYYISYYKLIECETNYGYKKSHHFTFVPYPYKNFKVLQIEKDVKEKVWCLEVEDNHSFVLQGGIVTGNCLNANLPRLLANGFKTRNGDCRPANSVNTAMQLTAVIFQIQSQDQFGGVGSMHFDYDIAPYVKKSFKKHLKKSLNRSILTDDIKDKILEMEELLRPCSNFKNEIQKRIPELNETINSLVFTNAWNYAIDDLEEEGKQSAQALYHNLNTLESRPGSQVPFTSINFGTDTSCEGRLVSKWILNASVDGIGKFHRTSIFPISIFQYKKGVNDKKGTPNYDLYEKVLESISKRIYPNIVNCNWSQNIEDVNDIDTMMSTMGK